MSNEGSTSQQPATNEGEVKPPSKNTTPKLYDIRESKAGGFEAILPGLVSEKQELIMGTSTKRFEVKEEAERAVEEARERVRIRFERWSLQKTFTEYFYRIDAMPDGTFQVTLPGLKIIKTGEYCGTTRKTFKSWDEAKRLYLQKRESHEELSQKPILELKMTDNEKISFSDIDSFDPQIAPSINDLEIPLNIKRYLLQEEKLAGSAPSTSTYQQTIKEKGWQNKLFAFVEQYLERDGKHLLEESQIEHLDALTPKQAINLATGIVIDLTKYKWADTNVQKDAAGKPVKTIADQQSVLRFLQEGLAGKTNKDWQGNGVCRNFACAVKAVFEAIKANQTPFNRLRNTFCLYEAGESFAPRRKRQNTLEMQQVGHAWNTFVSLSIQGAANAVIVDTTWAKKNLETKKVEDLDYTLKRMEPVVHAMTGELTDSAPRKNEQIRNVLSFYLLKIEQPGGTGDLVSPEEEREFYVSRAVRLMKLQGVPDELPNPLLEAISECYVKIAGDIDKTELETLWDLQKKNPAFSFSPVLTAYLTKKSFSVNFVRDSFTFADDRLQKSVLQQLKPHRNYAYVLKTSPEFRILVREFMPEELPTFSPFTDTEDAAELLELVHRSNNLRHYKNSIESLAKLSEIKTRELFQEARKSLKSLNQQRYEAEIQNLDDYQLLKQYDKLHNSLKGAK